MRSVHWLFVVSVALFVAGMVFIVAGARLARRAPTTEAATFELTPVGTVRQIMLGIVDPAATVVFDSVGTTITPSGTEEKAPKTEAEWQAVGNSAAALAEAGNLLLMGSRAVDTGAWTAQSRALIVAATAVLKAVEAKSATQVFDAGGAVYETCDTCHRLYQRGS